MLEFYLFRPFLTETKRELIHDFALPSAVLVMSFVGTFLFRSVERKPCLAYFFQLNL